MRSFNPFRLINWQKRYDEFLAKHPEFGESKYGGSRRRGRRAHQFTNSRYKRDTNGRNSASASKLLKHIRGGEPSGINVFALQKLRERREHRKKMKALRFKKWAERKVEAAKRSA